LHQDSKETNEYWGGFHKSWAQGVKRRAHPKIWEKMQKVERKAQMHDAKLE
jgi:cytochrome c556